MTEKELIKLVADKLEDYKHFCCTVQFFDELPHTDTGKIAKFEVMAEYIRLRSYLFSLNKLLRKKHSIFDVKTPSKVWCKF